MQYFLYNIHVAFCYLLTVYIRDNSCILQHILGITVAFCNHFARTVILYQYSIHFTSKPDVSKYYNNNQNRQLKPVPCNRYHIYNNLPKMEVLFLCRIFTQKRHKSHDLPYFRVWGVCLHFWKKLYL
jgi:hypothetical protein